MTSFNTDVAAAMTIKLPSVLPETPSFEPGIRRAPKRELKLSKNEVKLALRNALRYIPESLHDKLAPEFLAELYQTGRIYGYRYRPKENIKAKPVDHYKGKCLAGKLCS